MTKTKRINYKKQVMHAQLTYNSGKNKFSKRLSVHQIAENDTTDIWWHCEVQKIYSEIQFADTETAMTDSDG